MKLINTRGKYQVLIILFFTGVFGFLLYVDCFQEVQENEHYEDEYTNDVVTIYHESTPNVDVNSDDRVLKDGEYLVPEGMFEYDQITIILN
jgi:hypothetical protein